MLNRHKPDFSAQGTYGQSLMAASGLSKPYIDDDGNKIFKPVDLKSVSRMFDVPYNTLRDNYLK